VVNDFEAVFDGILCAVHDQSLPVVFDTAGVAVANLDFKTPLDRGRLRSLDECLVEDLPGGFVVQLQVKR